MQFLRKAARAFMQSTEAAVYFPDWRVCLPAVTRGEGFWRSCVTVNRSVGRRRSPWRRHRWRRGSGAEDRGQRTVDGGRRTEGESWIVNGGLDCESRAVSLRRLESRRSVGGKCVPGGAARGARGEDAGGVAPALTEQRPPFRRGGNGAARPEASPCLGDGAARREVEPCGAVGFGLSSCGANCQRFCVP